MPSMTIQAWVSQKTGIDPARVGKAIALLDEGHTVPFLARYRKEATGDLTDVQLREIQSALKEGRALEERRQQVLRLLEESGHLTPDLQRQLEAAQTLTAVEDLYLPYRPKRKTRASMAKEKGLEPLANKLWQGESLPAVSDEDLQGARDILAERFSEDAAWRQASRNLSWKQGFILSRGPADHPTFRQYADYREPLARAAAHRILALNRGESQKVLKIKLELPDEQLIQWAEHHFRLERARHREQLLLALQDAYKRLLRPALENDLRQQLTEQAENQAIHVFQANLKGLLMQPPVWGKTVLAIDPGFRTGCKVVVVDPQGNPLTKGVVIYPHPPQSRWKEALKTLQELINRHHVQVIGVGNGTAGQETAQLIDELLPQCPTVEGYVMLDEAGASVWSASEHAQKELPDWDPTERGTLSLARRLIDPLAELVKIDPKALGVGQYQHDVNQKELSEALDHVVEDCVNAVGVELNTASPDLLQHVAGLNSTLAKRLVEARPFKSRQELKKVKGLGAKTFEQAAGFLRIHDSAEPLDRTSIHPESYDAARQLLKRYPDLSPPIPEAARQLGVGEATLRDILSELQKPGRDPRGELPPPLRRAATSLADLKPGQPLTGIVRNVTDFGAFVDVGLKQAGLIHISQLGKRVKHPLEAVRVGETVEVEVLEVNVERGRISLKRIGVN